MHITRFLAPIIVAAAMGCAGCGDSAGVDSGAATKLAIVTQPGNAASGVAFGTQPIVQLRDDADNLVVTSGATVSAAINSGGGTLVGTAQAGADRCLGPCQRLRVSRSVAAPGVRSSPGLQAEWPAPVPASAAVSALPSKSMATSGVTLALVGD